MSNQWDINISSTCVTLDAHAGCHPAGDSVVYVQQVCVCVWQWGRMRRQHAESKHKKKRGADWQSNSVVSTLRFSGEKDEMGFLVAEETEGIKHFLALKWKQQRLPPSYAGRGGSMRAGTKSSESKHRRRLCPAAHRGSLCVRMCAFFGVCEPRRPLLGW